jgi:hypothetical protein
MQRMLVYGLRTLVDVRLTPISRKPGFSKRRLTEALTESGIEYVHLPVLGNSKWNRAGLAGMPAELDEARAAYIEHISGDQAREAIKLIADMAVNGPTGSCALRPTRADATAGSSWPRYGIASTALVPMCWRSILPSARTVDTRSAGDDLSMRCADGTTSGWCGGA